VSVGQPIYLYGRSYQIWVRSWSYNESGATAFGIWTSKIILTGLLEKKEAHILMVKRGRIVAFFLLLLIFAGTIGSTIQGVTKDIRLGLDLQGGFEILYDVQPIAAS